MNLFDQLNNMPQSLVQQQDVNSINTANVGPMQLPQSDANGSSSFPTKQDFNKFLLDFMQ